MSKTTAILFPVLLLIFTGIVFMARYNPGHTPYYGDALGYYNYLPATFIFHNLGDMDQLPADSSLPPELKNFAAGIAHIAHNAGTPHAFTQYTYGVALMELPFFMLAYSVNKFGGDPGNGYSQSYIVALFISGFFYALAGSLLILRICRRYFTTLQSAWAIVIMILCTHMFWFIFRSPGMSHIPLYFLYASVMVLTIQLHETPSVKYFVLLGLTVGIITLIRPTDIICAGIPLLYGFNNKETRAQKLKLVRDHPFCLLLALCAFALPLIPQLLYWKHVSGQYLFYSYGSHQSFNWDKPRIVEGLFYFNNGWLPYAPVMFFALVGFLFSKVYTKWLPVMMIIIPLYIYIIYSWYCYNYINGMGSRPMIHMYPLLVIPLTAFIAYLFRAAWPVKLSAVALVIFSGCMIWSFSGLMASGKFRSEGANFQYFRQMMFKSRVTYNDMLAYDLAEPQPDISTLCFVDTLAKEEFNIPADEHFVKDPADSTGFVYHIFDGEEFGKDRIEINYNKRVFGEASWLRCSARVMYTDFPGDGYQFLALGIEGTNGKNKKWKGCRIADKVGIADNSCSHADSDSLLFEHYEYGRWTDIYFFTKLPPDIENGDLIYFHVWNMNKKRLFVDNLKVELYRER